MPRRPALIAALFALAAPGPACAQSCDFSAITQLVNQLLATTPQVTGASVRLATTEQVLYEHYFGNFTAQTVVPVASASKLVSAATIMTLVEDGLLDLDAPVSQTLPAFSGDKAGMTLRQMFSHTSGLPGGTEHPVLSDRTITLAQAADQIACCIPMAAPPGTQFAYGGLSMHVGGRMAEVAAGVPWDTLFAQRIGGPLGLAHTDYEAFGATDNPRIAGGVRASLDDYGRVLEMLLGRGWFRGARILGPAAVAEMWKDQTFGVPIVMTPVPGVRYGLGAWRDLVGELGQPIRVSSPGAFGFTPWLELDLGYYGIFMVAWLYPPLVDEVTQIQALARTEIASCLPPPVAAGSPASRLALALLLLVAAIFSAQGSPVIRRYARPRTPTKSKGKAACNGGSPSS
jgi:CubicO group peptidase (beta-lactamase class C family)